MPTLRRICVFCGSSSGSDPAFTEAASTLGALLAGRSIGLVYGGGATGLMGTVADAALAAGGRVTGIIPTALGAEVAHPGLTELVEVPDMHTRKALMYERSDAFIALPGGIGTLEELAEALTWTQLGLHRKPIGVLDVSGYYDHLLAFLDNAVATGLLKEANRALLTAATDAADLVDRLAATEVGYEPKWQ